MSNKQWLTLLTEGGADETEWQAMFLEGLQEINPSVVGYLVNQTVTTAAEYDRYAEERRVQLKAVREMEDRGAKRAVLARAFTKTVPGRGVTLFDSAPPARFQTPVYAKAIAAYILEVCMEEEVLELDDEYTMRGDGTRIVIQVVTKKAVSDVAPVQPPTVASPPPLSWPTGIGMTRYTSSANPNLNMQQLMACSLSYWTSNQTMYISKILDYGFALPNYLADWLLGLASTPLDMKDLKNPAVAGADIISKAKGSLDTILTVIEFAIGMSGVVIEGVGVLVTAPVATALSALRQLLGKADSFYAAWLQVSKMMPTNMLDFVHSMVYCVLSSKALENELKMAYNQTKDVRFKTALDKYNSMSPVLRFYALYRVVEDIRA